MEKYLYIIDEMSYEAATLYCHHTTCKNCAFGYTKDCYDNCRNTFMQGIITGLAIEKLKERTNESKD